MSNEVHSFAVDKCLLLTHYQILVAYSNIYLFICDIYTHKQTHTPTNRPFLVEYSNLVHCYIYHIFFIFSFLLFFREREQKNCAIVILFGFNRMRNISSSIAADSIRHWIWHNMYFGQEMKRVLPKLLKNLYAKDWYVK